MLPAAPKGEEQDNQEDSPQSHSAGEEISQMKPGRK